MATVPKILSGARAKVIININDTPTMVGIWNNFSYSVVLGVTPAFILGRLSPAALQYTSCEPVQCSANGYRVLKHGPFVDGGVPTIKNMLTYDDQKLSVYDRIPVSVSAVGTTALPTAQITGAKPGGFNSALSARQLQDVTIPYMGLLITDESSGDNADDGMDLPALT